MNDTIKRVVATVLMVGVSLGATMQWGVPKIAYEKTAGSETVMTIDGSEVSREEFTYFLNAMYDNLESQGITSDMLQDETAGAALVSYVFDGAVEQEKYWHTIVNEFNAHDLKIDRQLLDAAAQIKHDEIESAGGREAWKTMLADAGMTEDLYDNSMAITVYMQMLYEAYYGENGTKFSEAEQRAYFEENYVVCKHILFSMTDELGGALDDVGLAEKYAQAEAVLAELDAGGDFEALMQEHSDDTGAMVQYPDGYVLTEGATSLTGFVETAKALEVGTYSDIVETELGWSIIYRCPLDPELYVDYADAIITLATGSDFYTEIEALMAEAEVEYADSYGDATSYENLMSYVEIDVPATETAE